MAKLKAQYDAWFNDVTGGRDYTVPSRIFLGAPQENPVLLTRQDWRGSGASWGPKGIGYWEVNVVARARYEIKLRFDPLKADGEATCPAALFPRGNRSRPVRRSACSTASASPWVPAASKRSLAEGPAAFGVKYVEVKRMD